MKRRSIAFAALILSSCASTPPPRVISQADAAADSPAAREASQLAPQAHARAEQLREQARKAYDDGDFTAAQILGEHSLAAYERAAVLSRYVKAEQRLAKAKNELEKLQTKLASLDEQQERLTSEADHLEMRVKTTLDKEPLGDVDGISPERAKARQEAARALASEARLLCLATELLTPGQTNLADTKKHLSELENHLGHGSVRRDLFPRAVQARSSCLKALTLARRPMTAQHPETSRSDELLRELTETGKLFAFRDDRGVVVQLRGNGTEEEPELLKLLGRTAQAHPDFPVLVVVHSGSQASERVAGDRAKSVAAALGEAGAKQVETHLAGRAQPLVPSTVSGAAERNERVEIVFVAPSR